MKNVMKKNLQKALNIAANLPANEKNYCLICDNLLTPRKDITYYSHCDNCKLYALSQNSHIFTCKSEKYKITSTRDEMYDDVSIPGIHLWVAGNYIYHFVKLPTFDHKSFYALSLDEQDAYIEKIIMLQ